MSITVVRVFNNNVVLATTPDYPEPVVLTGRGLGFQKKPGDQVPQSAVAQVFVAENNRDADTMAAGLADIPLDYVEATTRALAAADAGEVPSSTVVGLADHLQLAVRRQASVTADVLNPLTGEVKHLYPQEYATAQRLLADINRWLATAGTPALPGDEATAVAMHLVNAGFRTTDLTETYRMTGVFQQIFDIINAAFGTDIDATTVNAARFITHLRYLFVRLHQGRQLADGLGVLSASLSAEYPQAMSTARRIAAVLELRMGAEFTATEIAYLALHVVRLTRET